MIYFLLLRKKFFIFQTLEKEICFLRFSRLLFFYERVFSALRKILNRILIDPLTEGKGWEREVLFLLFFLGKREEKYISAFLLLNLSSSSLIKKLKIILSFLADERIVRSKFFAFTFIGLGLCCLFHLKFWQLIEQNIIFCKNTKLTIKSNLFN